ncbi:MAG TPA: low-density lipoprotein receptor class A repeat-containing protein [Polyangiaceae bacterium]|nr:low-density lipoprotein receptor class A repeat-containing protein [Polyangiaceae bacterium]
MRAPVLAELRRARCFACLLFACIAACGSASEEQPLAAEEFFQCPPGHPQEPNPEIVVLPMSAHCDGQVDCPGGQDEASCPGHFLCWDRPVLLAASDRCDGKVNCRYGDDEEDCPDQLLCGEGHDLYVVGADKFCDGRVDCRDRLRHDEQDCPDTFICTWPQIDGPDTHSGLPRDKVCDGSWDCPSDELDCPGADPFMCANGTTIDRRYLCDQRYHCRDGSDEAPAACPHQFECTEASIRQHYYPPGGSQDPTVCVGGCDPLFVPIEKACDGRADCRQGEDESELACLLVPCSETSPLLIARGKLCDGASDCPGASDEASCHP